MNLVHIIPSISPNSGGPARAIIEYVNMAMEFSYVTILTTDEGFEDLSPKKVKQRCGLHEYVNLLLFPYSGKHSRKYSPKMISWMRERLHIFEMAHIHAAFSLLSTRSAFMCRKKNVPYVFRPLGTLSPYSLKSGGAALKKVWWSTLEKRTVSGAKAIHATSQTEAEDISAISPEAHVSVIPIAQKVEATKPRTKTSKAANFGFISRIHPKKNIENLLRALAATGDDSTLTIAGTGDKKYVSSMKKLASQLGLGERVKWLGFIDGLPKMKFFSEIDFLVLPSFHENFGLAVAEAFAYGIPVLASNHVDVMTLAHHYGAGMDSGTNPDDIKTALMKAGSLSAESYQSMSSDAIRLVQTELSRDVISSKLRLMYGVSPDAKAQH